MSEGLGGLPGQAGEQLAQLVRGRAVIDDGGEGDGGRRVVQVVRQLLAWKENMLADRANK